MKAEKKIEQTEGTEDLKAKIKELEAKIADKEEAALKRVCKALGVSADAVIEKENRPPKKMVRCHVPYPIRINTQIYHGLVEISESTFEVIQQALGDRRMRLLRELTGNNYILDELCGPGMVPRVTSKVDLNGEKIS